MKNKILLLLFIIFIMMNNDVFSQTTFHKQIGDIGIDRGVTVEEIEGDGYIVTGYTHVNDSLGYDVLLLRTNSLGETLWKKNFGGKGKDNGWAVRQVKNGGFIIVGYTDGFGEGGMDIYLIRTDAEGNEIWTKTIGGKGDEYGWDIRNTKDGGFIIASETTSQGNGEIDAYLIKIDGNGNQEWTKSYGGQKIDRVFSVQQTTDGGYVAAGITYSFTSVDENDRDAYLIKTDSSGNLEWFKTFGGDAYDVGHAITLTHDDGYLITGYGESFTSNGTRDVYLIKTDAQGEKQWIKVYGDDRVDERGIKGEQTEDGGYIAIGLTDMHWDVYLVRTDPDGELLWTKTFGQKDQVEFGYTVRETRDSGFILTGHSESFDRLKGDVLLIKTDSQGQVKQ